MPCDAPASTDEVIAIEVWNMLNNGMGGLDLGRGLDLAVAYFGVRDSAVRGLLDRLRVIKGFRLADDKPADPEARVFVPRGSRGRGKGH